MCIRDSSYTGYSHSAKRLNPIPYLLDRVFGARVRLLGGIGERFPQRSLVNVCGDVAHRQPRQRHKVAVEGWWGRGGCEPRGCAQTTSARESLQTSNCQELAPLWVRGLMCVHAGAYTLCTHPHTHVHPHTDAKRIHHASFGNSDSPFRKFNK